MSESPFDGYSDAEVVAMLGKHEFRGPLWDRYCEYLCHHGISVTMPWIRSKRIFAEMRRRRIRCCGAVLIDDQSARDLATDATVRAISPFQAMLKSDLWDPRGPATLDTAFVSGCLQQFPNVYRAWLHHTFGRELERLELVPGNDQVAGHIEQQVRNDPFRVPFGGDPETILITRERQDDLLALLPDDLRAVVQLVGQGYTFTRAATALGEDPKKLRRRLHRIRPRLSRLWEERDNDPDS
jgi:DNA-directed RNA polymerase specialized sigma24 family protein